MIFKNTFKKIFKTDIDIVGMYASTICAVHCLVLPFLLVVLPLAGITFIADLLWEIVFMAIAGLVGITAISRSFKIHGRRLPIVLLSAGVLILIISKLEISHSHATLEPQAFLAFSGGILIATAHFVNLRFKNSAASFKKPDSPEFELFS